jgi:transcriptional regulator with XRE-family HTH domain
MYRLVDRDLLERLMQRTGTGAPISIRGLAKAANVPHGTIGNLLSGYQESVASDTAHRIAAALGVAVLILWIPPSSPAEQSQSLAVVPEQVSA